MTSTTVEVKPLERRLPPANARAFLGDQSESEDWITDGHLLVKASALDATMRARYGRMSPFGRRVAAESMMSVWDDAIKNAKMRVFMRGWAERTGSGVLTSGVRVVHSVMVLSGGGNPPPVFADAKKLSFLIATVKPTAFLAAKNDAPIVLVRDDAPVALLMPMRFEAESLKEYQLNGEVLSIEEATQKDVV